MKKITTLVIALLTAVTTISASNYKHSLGIVANLGFGAQYKTMITDHFTIFEEFGYFTCPDGGTGFGYAGAINNLVLAYQAKGTEGQNIQLDWYVGGQMKTGYIPMGGAGGLIGFGATVGFEANMKNAPMAFSFDFRPGYAVGIGGGNGTVWAAHMFDWTINLGVRYTIPTAKAAAKKK